MNELNDNPDLTDFIEKHLSMISMLLLCSLNFTNSYSQQTLIEPDTYSTYSNSVTNDELVTNFINSIHESFIHVSDVLWPVTGTFDLENSINIKDESYTFIKAKGKSEKSLIRLIAGYSDDINSFDPLVIYYDENATYNFDGQLDALKLYNSDTNVTNFYVFSEDGRRLSINAIPYDGDDLCTLHLGIKTNKNGEIIFRIKDITGIYLDKAIYITDIITGLNQDLTQGNQYSVSLPAGDYQNRFFLNLSNLITDTPDFTSDTDWINIYSSHGILKAEINLLSCKKGTLTILNLMGQALFIHKIYEAGYHEFSPVVKDGIYIVTFISGNRRVSKKIFIQSQ